MCLLWPSPNVSTAAAQDLLSGRASAYSGPGRPGQDRSPGPAACQKAYTICTPLHWHLQQQMRPTPALCILCTEHDTGAPMHDDAGPGQGCWEGRRALPSLQPALQMEA